MKVLLAGGGNAIHVLSSYVSALPDTHVTVLSLFHGEAERLGLSNVSAIVLDMLWVGNVFRCFNMAW